MYTSASCGCGGDGGGGGAAGTGSATTHGCGGPPQRGGSSRRPPPGLARPIPPPGAPTYLVQRARQRDALLLPPRQVDALLPNLRVCTRRQHLQVGRQAAGIHAQLPARRVKWPAKRHVALHCGQAGGEGEGGAGRGREAQEASAPECGGAKEPSPAPGGDSWLGATAATRRHERHSAITVRAGVPVLLMIPAAAHSPTGHAQCVARWAHKWMITHHKHAAGHASGARLRVPRRAALTGLLAAIGELAAHRHPPSRLLHLPQQRLHQRALAAAHTPHHAHQLAARNLPARRAAGAG